MDHMELVHEFQRLIKETAYSFLEGFHMYNRNQASNQKTNLTTQ